MKSTRIFQQIETYSIYGTIFLVPLVASSAFTSSFSTPKLIILVFGISLAVVAKAARLIIDGKVKLATSTFDLPVAILAAVYLAGAIFISPNKMEAFFLPGTTSFILSAALFYFLVTNLSKKEKKTVNNLIIASATMVAVIALFAISGILEKIHWLPSFAQETSFTTLASPLLTATFLASIIPLGIFQMIKQKDLNLKTLYLTVVAMLTLGIGAAVINLAGEKNQDPLLSFNTSWVVVVDTLKESPLLGVGPGNYLTAFNRFRPLTYNQSQFWNIRFTNSRNFYFTVITEVGFLGAMGLITLLLFVFRQIKTKHQPTGPQTSLVTLLLLLALFPSSPSLVFLLFILLAVSSTSKAQEFDLAPSKSKLPALFVALPTLVVVAVLFFFGGRVILAEARYKIALEQLARNQGKETYNTLREAINLNPSVDRYHATYAQINLALAQSITSKEDLTENDRQTIAQLIQQAIREAKTTATLNRSRASNWELLANVYRAIMPFAEGADEFATQAMQQAVALDPINPSLRIALGGIYFALGNYDEAAEAFRLATLAKADHANAHYNLAATYREKGELDKAIQELTVALSLVNKDSPDYQLAKNELEALEQKKATPESQEGEELTPP